ncbi:MAG TPA: MFS transporter [Terracidiphilus sp.]|nr:MFS transporter [Terracidiphilus sp.]
MLTPESREAGIAHKELRRRWFLLMPAVFVTYSLAYLDRANYGFGAAAGLAQTLHITGSQTALLGALFFLGYLFFQIPGAAYAQRKSACRIVFFALISWGTLAALTGVIRVFWLLALDRLLLGVAESFIFPSLLILLTHWFTRRERSRANATMILANPITMLWMSAITGYLIHLFGWQMTFIIEGIPSILWAFVWIAVARDHPQEARWLSEASCAHLSLQFEQEQRNLPRMRNLLAACRLPGVLILCVQYFAWSVGLYGFILWLPTILKAGMREGIETVGFLSVAPYLLAVAFMLAVAQFSDRSLNRKHFVWPFLLLSGVGLFGSYVSADHNFWIAYVFLIVAGGAMYAPYGPYFAMIPEMLPANVAGEVMALINSFGALGGFVGAWLVGELEAVTGNSRAGFLFMSASLLLAGVLVLILRQGTTRANATEQLATNADIH